MANHPYYTDTHLDTSIILKNKYIDSNKIFSKISFAERRKISDQIFTYTAL